ncbi:MAG: hypothetical protein LAT75_04135 [Candidatus Cyclonatronum sp.]|uniref:hypothetical protein n=1 Tax=Cyclonatronum sp. TaxID=3024185 RepID=UPI0025BC46D9|nr:hypothetical protein [Cyclonatronum sp.]MCC5932645.1 hypothetical protein [Balneolales bacterium]MCH8486029.1 hypothetical protein [Cyclonatronum sp.]
MLTEEAKKALYYARPFVTAADYEDVKQGDNAAAAKRIRNRSWFMLLISVLVSSIFLLNSVFRVFEYLETERSGALTAVVLWALVGLVCLISGFRYYMRLSRTGRWLLHN